MDVPMDMDANLREKVWRRIRLAVIAGEVEPGTVYSVPALSRQLGISTTPIREALLQLTSDGILQPLRNRGFRVVNPSIKELRDLFDVRLQLEVSAVVKLASDGLPDVRELVQYADDAAAAVEQGNVPAYLDADRAFHSELLTRSGNLVLADIVMRLRDRMRLYGIRSPAGVERQRQSVAEHYLIIESVQRRGSTDVATLMKEHIMSWQPVFLDAIRARQIG